MPVKFWLLDTVSVSLVGLVVGGMVLRLEGLKTERARRGSDQRFGLQSERDRGREGRGVLVSRRKEGVGSWEVDGRSMGKRDVVRWWRRGAGIGVGVEKRGGGSIGGVELR